MQPQFFDDDSRDFDDDDYPNDSEFADDDDHDDDFDDAADVIPCPECGEDIYDDVIQCPHCHAYVTADTSVWSGRSWWWIAVGVLGILAVIYSLTLGM